MTLLSNSKIRVEERGLTARVVHTGTNRSIDIAADDQSHVSSFIRGCNRGNMQAMQFGDSKSIRYGSNRTFTLTTRHEAITMTEATAKELADVLDDVGASGTLQFSYTVGSSGRDKYSCSECGRSIAVHVTDHEPLRCPWGCEP